jgi:electron transfer flavoprotein alpha subunit
VTSTLVVAVHDGAQLDDRTGELIAAARTSSGTVVLGVVAADPQSLLDQAQLAGADEVLFVRTPSDRFEPELQHQAVRALIDSSQPRLILLGFGVGPASYGAALAAELDLGFAADVVGLTLDSDEIIARKPLYGGKVHAELAFPADVPVLLLLQPGSWTAEEVTEAAAAPTRELTFEAAAPSVRRLERAPRPTGDVDLAGAPVIFAIGRGIGAKERVGVFADLAKRMGVPLGASRPLVDSGWMPPDRQIGQSGQSVKPRLYVAFGISGSLQHWAGITGSRTIVAINTDENAPIFDLAHYGAFVDMFAVAEELEKLV